MGVLGMAMLFIGRKRTVTQMLLNGPGTMTALLMPTGCIAAWSFGNQYMKSNNYSFDELFYFVLGSC
jgi:Ca2+/H+ antiporter